jgi:DNA-binding transcriptional MerR regulator
MRIGELSARTGVPAATIKYYVREGLLFGGERRSHNQVEYGEDHVRRLRLVRAMVEVGSVPIAKVREVLAEIEDPGRDLDSTLGVASRALSQHRVPPEEPAAEDLETARGVVRRQGWDSIPPDHGYMWTLADAIGRLRELGLADMVDLTGEYARAAEIVAEFDIRLLGTREERDEILEAMVVGTVLGDAIFAALRRLAQVEISGRTFQRREKDQEIPEDRESLRERLGTAERGGPSILMRK